MSSKIHTSSASLKQMRCNFLAALLITFSTSFLLPSPYSLPPLHASHVTIVGPGAVGSFYGARLQQTNTNSSFTFYSPRSASPHISECQRNGLTVNSNVYPTIHVPHSPPTTSFTSSISNLKPSGTKSLLASLLAMNAQAFSSLRNSN